MKKLLSVVAAAWLVSCATAPVPVAPPQAAAPAPAAREVSYEEALPTSVKSYYPNGDLSSSSTTQYTPAGLLLRQESFNGNGVLIEIRTGKSKGDLWRVAVANAQSGEVVSYEDRSVGPSGELLVQTFLNAKEVVQASNEWVYEQGRKVQWIAKTGSGGLQAKTLYFYDARGNNTKTEVYDAAGNLANVFESTYDQDRITLRRGFDAASRLVEQTAFTWKDGRKIKEETLKPLLRTIEYSYGEKPAPTGVVSSVRGKVVERQTLEYQWFTKTKTITP